MPRNGLAKMTQSGFSRNFEMKNKSAAFIADPIQNFHPVAETTFFLLLACQEKGFENYIMEIQDLYLENGSLFAQAKKIWVEKNGSRFSYKLFSKKKIDLSMFDICFLRKDPPVDQPYTDHLHLLRILEENNPKIKFINSPRGIQKANEKLYPFHFKGLSPPTVVSACEKVLMDFIKKYPQVILKPLYGAGGVGVELFKRHAPGLEDRLRRATHGFKNAVMLQKYLKEAKRGDKRILLWDGKPLGAFLRVPAKNDFRGNMHQGATWKKASITEREKEMMIQIAPILKKDGLRFVGLDVIGNYITEINVTSPMGIREINELESTNVESIILRSLLL